LNNLSKNKEIKLSDDILKRNYPNVKFPKYQTRENTPYNDDDFLKLSLLVKNMIKLYFSGNCKNKSLLVKASYWYLAMYTGFNQTGMNSLNLDSFKLISKDNNKFFYITCEKNRSEQVKQIMIIPLSKDNDLFIKMFDELKKINTDVDCKDKNLFSYNLYEKTYEYLGESIAFHKLDDVKKHIEKNKIKNIKRLSTSKIRQFFSSKMMDSTKSVLLVSKMMGHKNVKTTEKHYMKHQINNDLKFKFNIVQNLMNSFSNNNDFNDWVVFQNAFGISKLTIEELHFKIKNGDFDNAVGKCIKDLNYKEDKCKSYINCLSCRNFTIIGEIDLWKIISFKESLINNCSSKDIDWILNLINNTISEIDNELLIVVKKRISKSGLYPFWKNELMIKTIFEEYISE